MLTPRQREVLALVTEGLKNREIAEQLGISAKTVDTHLSLAFRELDQPNRTAAAVEYARRRWVAGEDEDRRSEASS